MGFYAAIESDDMEGLTMFPFGLYAGSILNKKLRVKLQALVQFTQVGKSTSATSQAQLPHPPAWTSVLNPPAAPLRIHSRSPFKTKLACTIWFRE
jgi:hypothetical protein